MNQRIKQLAQQAGLFSARPSGTSTRVMLATIPGSAGETGDPDTQLEKFAELIVRELANHIAGQLPDERLDDWYNGYHAGVQRSIDCLKHFGVEE